MVAVGLATVTVEPCTTVGACTRTIEPIQVLSYCVCVQPAAHVAIVWAALAVMAQLGHFHGPTLSDKSCAKEPLPGACTVHSSLAVMQR